MKTDTEQTAGFLPKELNIFRVDMKALIEISRTQFYKSSF
jgi:hypothetical protein